jgi:hypothetical protein
LHAKRKSAVGFLPLLESRRCQCRCRFGVSLGVNLVSTRYQFGVDSV